MKSSLSLQMWSLRDEMKTDFARTVDAVAKFGYPAVELAGYGNLDVRGAKAALDAAGLKVSGMHVGPSEVQGNLQQIISDALLLGTRHVVIAWWPGDQFVSAAACQRIGELMDGWGESLRAFGLQLSFHNHAPEFCLIDGKPALEWVLSAAQPRNLTAEIDVFWARAAGYSPARFILEQGRRVPLVHLKDKGTIGSGPVEFPPIFTAIGLTESVEWLVVEQEEFDGVTPLDAARENLAQLKRWGWR